MRKKKRQKVWAFVVVDKNSDNPKYDGCVSVHRTERSAREWLVRQIKGDIACEIISHNLRHRSGLVWYNDRMTYAITEETVNEG